jgi:hypothetical protein
MFGCKKTELDEAPDEGDLLDEDLSDEDRAKLECAA